MDHGDKNKLKKGAMNAKYLAYPIYVNDNKILNHSVNLGAVNNIYRNKKPARIYKSMIYDLGNDL